MAIPRKDLNNPKSPGDYARQLAMAMELPFLLVAPAIVCGAIGFLLDIWLHTKPVFLLILGLAGVVIGIVDVLKLATAQDKANRD